MEVFENSKLSAEHLPELVAQDFEQLPSRYFRLRLWTWAIVCGVSFCLMLGGLLWAVFEEDMPLTNIPTILWGFSAAWFLFMCSWGFSEFQGFDLRGYAVRERDLSFRSGYFFHTYTTVPFNRLQHSEISQGPLARAMKLCTLKIYTAGSSGANLSIAGMDPIDAQRIRDYIDEHGIN
tara:strand:+ start:3837 stop:4370 length:534 start_codon:yes stop_codon:yes gene_type:complete